MGRVKEILIDGYEKTIDFDKLIQIRITTIDGNKYTIQKNELDVIDDTYIQHSINGDYISYSRIDEDRQTMYVKQIFLKHIITIQAYYEYNKV